MAFTEGSTVLSNGATLPTRGLCGKTFRVHFAAKNAAGYSATYTSAASYAMPECTCEAGWLSVVSGAGTCSPCNVPLCTLYGDGTCNCIACASGWLPSNGACEQVGSNCMFRSKAVHPRCLHGAAVCGRAPSTNSLVLLPLLQCVIDHCAIYDGQAEGCKCSRCVQGFLRSGDGSACSQARAVRAKLVACSPQLINRPPFTSDNSAVQWISEL